MRLLALLLAAIVLLASPASAAPRVVASILPVEAILSAVMGETGQPELLLRGALSEHRAVFTPAQVALLGEADLVFMVGGGLEAKLMQLSGSEAVNGKRFVSLSSAPGLRTLPVRSGGAWEPDHDHGAPVAAPGAAAGPASGVLAFDPHVWLDPENAKAMAREAARVLGAADPGRAQAYAANAEAFAARADGAAAAAAQVLAPVQHIPYVVFHDAFQYFEARFGLAGAGSISDVSAQAPSARRLAEVRDKIIATGARCVFREPQYDDRAVAAVTEGTGARSGVLDPLGADIAPGPDAYPALIAALAGSLASCLGGA